MKAAITTIVLTCMLFVAAGCSRTSRDELIQEGTRKVQEKNYRGAVVLFKSILEKDEEDVQARFLLADAYLNAGKLELAEREFARVADRVPGYPGLQMRRAELMLRGGRAGEALREIEAFLGANPADAASLALRGRAQVQDGQAKAGEESLREAALLAPGDRSIRLALADCLGRQGKDAAARDLLQELIREQESDPEPYRLLARLENAAGDTPRALALYRRAVELKPDDIQSTFMVGLLLLEQRESEQVARLADDLLKRYPNEPRGLQLKGFISYLDGRYEESAMHLQRVAEQHPDLLTFYVLGMDYLRLGRSELAVTQFQRILDYRPQAVQARTVLALVLLQQERTDEAINELKQVLQADDGQALAHHLLGSALLAKGRYDQAMEEFDRAIQLDPELVQAHLQKGLFTLSRGDIDRGEGYLVQALAVAPELPNVRLILAAHLLQQKKFAEASRTLHEGLTGTAADAILYNFLAAASFGQHKNEEAVGYLEKAKAAKPDYFTPYYNLATYYAGKGDHQRARREYQAVVALDPKEAKAWLLQAKLAEEGGHPEEALSCYRQAKETGKSEGLVGLVVYLVRRQEIAEAMALLNEGLRAGPHSADLLQLKARLLLGGKRYPEALQVAEDLVKADPERGFPLAAEVLLAQGEIARAERSAESMVARFPNKPAGYLLLAGIQERRGETLQALKTVESAPAACRKDPLLRLKRAELLQKGEKYAPAAAALEELVREHPDLTPAWFALGQTYDRLGNSAQASRCYREVLSRQPEFVPALNNLAYHYADLPEKREEAVRLAQRANRREPDNPWILDTLGYAYLRQDRLSEAKAFLERAAGLLPDEPSVLYHLGLLQHRLGHRDEAVRNLRKALASGSFAEADRTRALIDEITAAPARGNRL